MAKFLLYTDEKKKQKKRFQAYFYLIVWIISIVFFILSDNRRELMFFVSLVIFVSGIVSGVYSLANIDKVLFLEIDEYHIEWFVNEKNQGLTSVEWKDVRWIKKEKNNSISIFMDSSFNKNLSLADFAEEDQKSILHLLEQNGTERQIRLVNFSEPALAPA